MEYFTDILSFNEAVDPVSLYWIISYLSYGVNSSLKLSFANS